MENEKILTLLDALTEKLQASFEAVAPTDEARAMAVDVSYSRRPDLCDFQSSSSMKCAKAFGLKPLELAQAVADHLKENEAFSAVTAEAPGFINMTLSENWIIQRLQLVMADENLGVVPDDQKKKVIVDFGGANVAKALHVGHLRSAVIGESLIRLLRIKGHQVIGDIHLGDWGLQMGLVIEMLREEAPDLPYFTPGFEGPFPKEAPFDIAGLTRLYTEANIKSKAESDFRDRAVQTTAALQQNNPGYDALWHHILSVSKVDLAANYSKLQVQFDLWLGESDSQPAIPSVIERLESLGLLVESEGARVVHVESPSDKKPMPPCIIQKANGASLYATTDLATIWQRVEDHNPDLVLYVVDKRQDLHFEQVFRTARLANIAKEKPELDFIGFGTMNGKDGKPFKTRDGGVMALQDLIQVLIDGATEKLDHYSHVKDPQEKADVALAIGVGALKFADLSNLPERDYVFDIAQFASFEGKTGPYVQYAGVRMASIIGKLVELGIEPKAMETFKNPSERALASHLIAFGEWVNLACAQYQPAKICDYAFTTAQCFNALYHDVHVIGESPERQSELLWLLSAAKQVIDKSLWLLGIQSLEKM